MTQEQLIELITQRVMEALRGGTAPREGRTGAHPRLDDPPTPEEEGFCVGKLLTEQDVMTARAAGHDRIIVDEKCLITPLARDKIRELAMDLVRRS